MRWFQKLLKKFYELFNKESHYDTLRKSIQYRGNTEALQIIDSLEWVSKRWNSNLPISFYIADCDEKILNQILCDLGYHNPVTKRKSIGKNLFAVMVRPKG